MEQLETLTIQNKRTARRLLPASGSRGKGGGKEQLSRLKARLLGEGKEEGAKPFPWKSISVRNVVIGACALLILLAAYLNLRFAGETPTADGEGELLTDPASSTGALESEDDYFAVAVINRSRARDEALDMYQAVADDESATQTSRDQAYASMNALVDRTAAEIDIENQIKAKGFSDCVAILEGERANIIVRTQGLTDSEVAQITEIVYLQAGIIPQNMTITEKV